MIGETFEFPTVPANQQLAFWLFVSTFRQVCLEVFLMVLLLLHTLFYLFVVIAISLVVLVSARYIFPPKNELPDQSLDLSSEEKYCNGPLSNNGALKRWDSATSKVLQKQTKAEPKGRFLIIGFIAAVTDTMFCSSISGFERVSVVKIPTSSDASWPFKQECVPYRQDVTSMSLHADIPTTTDIVYSKRRMSYQELPMYRYKPSDKEFYKTKTPISYKFFPNETS